MNAFKASEKILAKSESLKITTTLYDLLNDYNTTIFGPHWEHVTCTEGDRYKDNQSFSLATLKINRMFEAGKLTFKRPRTIENYLLDLRQ